MIGGRHQEEERTREGNGAFQARAGGRERRGVGGLRGGRVLDCRFVRLLESHCLHLKAAPSAISTLSESLYWMFGAQSFISIAQKID